MIVISGFAKRRSLYAKIRISYTMKRADACSFRSGLMFQKIFLEKSVWNCCVSLVLNTNLAKKSRLQILFFFYSCDNRNTLYDLPKGFEFAISHVKGLLWLLCHGLDFCHPLLRLNLEPQLSTQWTHSHEKYEYRPRPRSKKLHWGQFTTCLKISWQV